MALGNLAQRFLVAVVAVPILLVQHMPPKFTLLYAERLAKECAMEVKEASDGERIMPGRILIAPSVAERDGDVEIRIHLAEPAARSPRWPRASASWRWAGWPVAPASSLAPST